MSIGAHRFGLIPRFAVGALAVFGVVAAVLLTIMSNQLRGSQEGAAQFHAVFVTNSVLRYELAALDLRQPVSARRAAELEAFIRDRVLQYPTLRLKIWRPDGTVVFSDDFRAIGLHFTDSLRQKSLDGNTAVSEVAPPRRIRKTRTSATSAEALLDVRSTPSARDGVASTPGTGGDLPGLRRHPVGHRQRGSRLGVHSPLPHSELCTCFFSHLVSGAARELSARNLALGRSEGRFRSLVQNSSDVTHIVSSAGRVTYTSPSSLTVFGFPDSEQTGQNVFDLIHPDDCEPLRQVLDLATLNPSHSYPAVFRWRHHDGSWRHGESIITVRVDDASIGGIVVNTRDVTARWTMEQQLLKQAFHEPLTGLANRALLGDRLQQAVERGRRDGCPASVIFMDLDDFKAVNDSLGHGAGDELLCLVTDRISGVLRATDTAARLGGDEFALLIEGAILTEAIAVVERALGCFAAPFVVNGREITISASAGIAIGGADTAAAADMLRDADIAMYSAKAGGTARFAIYHAEMYRDTMERLQLRAGIDDALARQEFVLHYQPVVDLCAGRTTGFEALVRWNHPTRGLVAPADFITVAEESGSIIALGRWVLFQACEDASVFGRGAEGPPSSLWL